MGSTTRLLLDSRECALRRALDACGMPYTQHQLAVGDVELQCTRSGVVWNVERKSLLDYAASIRDGRLKAQRARAMEFAAGNPRVRLAYIVESESVPSFLSNAKVGGGGGGTGGASTRGVSEAAIAGSILRLTVRDSIPVLWSGSVRETAALLQQLVKALDAQAAVTTTTAATTATADAPTGTPTDVQPDLAGPVQPTIGAKRPRDLRARLSPVVIALCAVHGMSEVFADAVATKYPTGRALVAASLEDLAGIQVSAKRRLGTVLAQRVKQVFG